jgi:hypothetical protein
MDDVLRCDCGFEARGPTEDELVAEVRRHARETHHMTLTRTDALLLARNAAAAGRTTRAPTTRTEKEG